MSIRIEDVDFDQVSLAWSGLREATHLGPIRNEADYDERVELLHALIDIVRDNQEHPLAGLLEIVGDMIGQFDDSHRNIPKSSPQEVLLFLMQENGLNQSDLSDVASQGVISELLSGKRAINLRQAKALAARFNVPPELFV